MGRFPHLSCPTCSRKPQFCVVEFMDNEPTRYSCTKIIFLDVEGVMVSYNHIWSGKYRGENRNVPEPHLADRINMILQATGAVLVICGAMRLHYQGDLEGLKEKLGRTGLRADAIIGMTGPTHSEGRGYDIQEWLDNHPGNPTILVIDDEQMYPDDYQGPMNKHLLRMKDRAVGITEAEMLEAIRRLR